MLCLELRYLAALLSLLGLLGAIGATVMGEPGSAVGYLFLGGIAFGLLWRDLEPILIKRGGNDVKDKAG